MPHDKNGVEVKVGDLVTITARVKERHETEDYCNLTLVTVEPMHPHDPLRPAYTALTLNAKQVQRRATEEQP